MIISPAGRGRFEAHLDGRYLCKSADPITECARLLLQEGYNPASVLIMRHRDSAVEAMRETVGRLASVHVVEDSRGKPVFRPWKAKRCSVNRPPVRPIQSPLPEVGTATTAYQR